MLTLLLVLSLAVSLTAAAEDTEHHMDAGVVTIEPTCQTIGVITYTCQDPGCGYSYTEKIGNLGHQFVDGVCTRCGAAEEVHQETTAQPVTEQETTVSIVRTDSVLNTAPETEAAPASHSVVTSGAQTGDASALPALLLLGCSLGGALLLSRRKLC